MFPLLYPLNQIIIRDGYGYNFKKGIAISHFSLHQTSYIVRELSLFVVYHSPIANLG